MATSASRQRQTMWAVLPRPRCPGVPAQRNVGPLADSSLNGEPFAGGSAKPPPSVSRSWSVVPRSSASALHRLEEFPVRLGVLHLVEQEFDRGKLIHGVQELAQDPHLGELALIGDQLFLAGAGTVDVDRREHALLGDAPVEVDLAVAGALELLVDDIVHLRAGIDERRRQDGETAALLDVARRAEEALGALQCVGVDAAGEDLAG